MLLLCGLMLLDGPLAYSMEVKTKHPRLVNPAEVAAEDNKTVLRQLRKKADFDLATPEDEIVRRPFQDVTYIRLYALLAYVDRDDRYLEKARRLVAARGHVPETTEDQKIRTRLQAMAYYYDLLFDRLDEDEKRQTEERIIDDINWLNKHKYLRSENFGGGHEHYANISALVGALAIYHERPEVQAAAELLEKNMKEGFLPFYRYLAQDDGGNHMWWEYGRYYIFSNLEFLTIWRNATGEDLFQDNSWLNKSADFIIYGLRDDMSVWGTGDNHSRHPGWKTEELLRGIAAEYDNGYSAAMAQRLADRRRAGPDIDQLFYQLLWDEPATASELSGLPLFKAFNRVGAFVFREGWSGDNVMALFKNSPVYFFNHSHRDANSFEIWYKNDLAIDSGFYDAYFSEHWFNYYTRTIAHNTVTIYDPDETIADWDKIQSNDGGQLFSQASRSQPYNVDDLNGDIFRIAENEVLADNPDYTVVRGDATRAYSAHKCSLFQRYFVWLRKFNNWPHPIIVVFDRIISPKIEYTKRWLLHAVNEPQVDGNRITVVNGGGKLWSYVIQPQNFHVELVGGKDREFEVKGINYPIGKSIHGGKEWAGSWRVELSENSQREETHFLNVLVPVERRARRQPDIEPVDGGVRVENWSVRFEDGELSVQDLKTGASDG